MASTPKPILSITPDQALIDEELSIIVNGLLPKQRITLVSRVNEKSGRFYSYAFYVSDDAGHLDLTTMPAEDGGCYEEIEPMGLIWSQKQEPGQKPGRRLTTTDVTIPIVTHVYVLSDFVIAGDCIQLIDKGQWLDYARCKRTYMAEGVQRLKVRDGQLRGTLFIPNGFGKFPGVIDLFGGIGGIIEYRSALLASRGVASFALGYITMTEHEVADMALLPEPVPIEYFEEAIDYLLKHPKVLKPYAGIIGVSKGAEIALLTASLCHKIRACVEINGSHIITTLSHSYKNEEFPHTHVATLGDEFFHDGAYSLQGCYYHRDRDYEYRDIPVERGKCKYLLIHGADDQVICQAAAEYIPNRLHKHGKTNYHILMYPGAGHLLEPPHSPLFFVTYQMIAKHNLLWGGHPRQHARAQEDAWKQVLNFFKETLGESNVHHSNL